MKPVIVNKCKKNYRTDFEKTVRRIVSRIPDKFLAGLSEIVFLDSEEEAYPRIRHIRCKKSKIEINMDYEEYSKYPFFSIFALNMDFVLSVNEHIRKCLKPATDDSEILSIHEGRINYRWMYFGVWAPFMFLLTLVSYPVQKISLLRKIIYRCADGLVNSYKK